MCEFRNQMEIHPENLMLEDVRMCGKSLRFN